MKFLVVDDSPTMRRIVNNALGRIGYTDVVEAEDGRDGMAKLSIEEIDFIITDWNMPNMNGLQFTKTVRTSSDYAGLPILMVTTRSGKEDVLEALQARVNNYITKPFTPQVLKEKIDQILQSRR
ncbi:MAG: response regulator [Calditrichaeota bacterium]|nr:response regulator [Calditrichota bacterium]MCB0266630.1 response regulator [Calditrichota bacterium]MCB0285372.1 response regulator [Calditrichota bacterium]MCB0299942.1 response regulator [Calditrichota bacterium]MCB9068152.1 response regulator [Calditrichia bacterium]